MDVGGGSMGSSGGDDAADHQFLMTNIEATIGGPTHVSAVRSESVLAGKVHVGDIFISIDGEDVRRMNSKEITNIVACKAEFEQMLQF